MLAIMEVRRFPTLRTVAAVALALLTIVGSAVPAAAGDNPNHDRHHSTLFATGQIGAVLLAIDVKRRTATVIGPTGQPGSLALAIAPDGKAAYTVAKFQSAAAQLARIDLATGVATLVGKPIGGNLQIMGMTFGHDGVLYAGGDFDPGSPTFNSLYRIDLSTGLARRIGSFGVGVMKSDFIMSFASDSDGNLYGASTISLYRIHLTRPTNLATKVVGFVGSSQVMGIAIDEHGGFLAADFVGPPTLSTIYRVNIRTGFLTPLFNSGIASVHNMAFSHQRERDRDDDD